MIEADGVNVAKDRSRCYGYVCFITRVVFLQSFTAGQSSAQFSCAIVCFFRSRALRSMLTGEICSGARIMISH